MASKKFTAAEVIKAIEGSKGIISQAARKLGCTRQTVYNYVENYVTVKEALENEREDLLDFVEGKLLGEINNGNMTAIIFYLKTQGKSRGYVERQEVTGAGGKDLRVQFVWQRLDDEDG